MKDKCPPDRARWAKGRASGQVHALLQVIGIAALIKPAGMGCLHCKLGYGIYETRLDECRTFAYAMAEAASL